MGKFQIFPDGRAAGSAPVSGSDFVIKSTLEQTIAPYTSSIVSASYSSVDSKIYFYDRSGSSVAFIEAEPFIVDGMLESASVSGSYLVLTFNADASKNPISMSLTQIFDPDNYYTKSDVDILLGNLPVGDTNVIEAIEVNGTASTITNKTASITVPEEVWVRGTGANSVILSGSEGSATGQFGVAEGYKTVASGNYSHAEGFFTTSSGEYSHAEGGFTVASGESSHAEGTNTKASGNFSHAEGIDTTALGNYSHAEGSNTLASGSYSHAEGISTIALRQYSHAEGTRTKALAESSHAEGQETLASGTYSHAEGQRTTASGMYSHAEGFRTVAPNYAEHAQGAYNATASDQIFSVGSGRSDTNRVNAISVLKSQSYDDPVSASVYIYGVGTYDGTNPQPGVNDLATVISASAGGSDLDTGSLQMRYTGSYEELNEGDIFYQGEIDKSAGNLLDGGASYAGSFIHLERDWQVYGSCTITVYDGSTPVIRIEGADIPADAINYGRVYDLVNGTTSSYGDITNVPDIEYEIQDELTASCSGDKLVKVYAGDIEDVACEVVGGEWEKRQTILSTFESADASSKAVLRHALGAQGVKYGNTSGEHQEGDIVYQDEQWAEVNPSYSDDEISMGVTRRTYDLTPYIQVEIIDYDGKFVSYTDSDGQSHPITSEDQTLPVGAQSAIAEFESTDSPRVEFYALVSASLNKEMIGGQWWDRIKDVTVGGQSVVANNVAAIPAIPNLPTPTAADNGKVLQVVSGSYALVTPSVVYIGGVTPSASLGNNGDIYLMA